MDYSSPLIEGQFLKRYKRFFADIEIDGKKVVAHVPNTGSLKGVCDEPRPCRVSPSDNPERKLKFTLEQVKTNTSWVGVNTHKANDLAWEAFQNKIVPHWKPFIDGAREVKISAETRLDFKFVNRAGRAHFVEVKNVTLAEKNTAQFPDAETTRGQKHLTELMNLLNEEVTCEILFVVQRNDCTKFSPAEQIDPLYAELLRQAHKKGVMVTALPAKMTDKKIILTAEPLTVVL